MTYSLYTDGGNIGRNPSSYGGTWAWVLVENNTTLLQEGSGIITPEDFGVEKISNNQAELYAAIRALIAVSKQWDGTLYTDSMVTCHRLTGSMSFAGIPSWLVKRTLALRRGRKWKVEMVGGHPTIKELSAGKKANGFVVSRWNVRCDKMCSGLAKEFLCKENAS